MIGLFALAGWPQEEQDSAAECITRNMATRPEWSAEAWRMPPVAIGHVSPKSGSRKRRADDGRLVSWLDGFLREGNDRNPASLEDLAQRLDRDGAKALRDVQGEFVLLVYNRETRKLLAATDRYGIRTTYWRQAGGQVAVASEPRLLFESGLIRPDLNLRFLAALLRFKKCRLGDETLFRGLHVCPPGSLMTFDLSSPEPPKVERYFLDPWQKQDQSPEDWIEDVLPLVRSALNRSLEDAGGSCGLALTGGLDSRLLVAAADPDTRRRLRYFSYGFADCDEMNLARRVADAAGGVHEAVCTEAGDFLETASLSVRRNEEFDLFVQGITALMHRRAADAVPALMTGWDIDVPLRGTYLNETVLNLAGDRDVENAVDRHWSLFSSEELGRLLHPSLLEQVDLRPEDWVRDLVARMPDAGATAKYLRFVFDYEKRRLLMLRNRMIRFELESVTPLYNGDLQQALFRIPEALTADNALFARILVRMDPSLAEIPYQRTLLPASAPPEAWMEAARREAAKEAENRRKLLAGNGYEPYRRYYSNFDEWLLRDAGWKAFCDDLLLSKNAVFANQCARRETVVDLVEQYRTGEKDHWYKLVTLMSVELYLREYFS